MALTLTLNGQSHEFGDLDDGATLAEAIEALGMKPDRVAVERNGEIVPRATWGQVRLAPGDKLEVVHFVGGGSQDAGDPAVHQLAAGSQSSMGFPSGS